MSQDTQENEFWSKANRIVEKCSGQCVPKCVQEILNCCGFNHLLSWTNFSDENLSEIVEYVRKFSHDKIKKFDCTRHGCTIAHYKNQKEFDLLPGHRNLIAEVAKYINKDLQENIHLPVPGETIKTHLGSTKMMEEMIQTDITNRGSKHCSTYSEIMKYFATYLFIMCGRSCYDFLYQNLPLPSISTVCK